MSETKSFKTAGELPAVKPSLLIVEDELQAARAIKLLLRDHFEITLAADGIEATSCLQRKTFDIILSDIRLPGIDGIELLRLVRTYDLDVPVLLMTGDPTLEDAVRAVDLGALGFVVKPIESRDLIHRLERGLTLARLTKAKKEANDLQPLGPHGEGGHIVADRTGLLVRLESAIANLHLHFQPIISARERRIVAFEALMRSSEPAMASPAAILDAAERLDDVESVTQRVMRLAADAMPSIPESAQLFVNIHAHDVRGNRIFSDSCPLHVHGPRVVLEITERGAIDGIPGLQYRAKNLRDLGFRLAIDDIGAGYAGLTSFASIEPEIVKIDMSLIRGIDGSIIRQRIVTSIIRLCRELSMEVVAEGIETHAELSTVVGLGVDLLQGFLLGAPKENFAVTFPAW